MMRELEHETDAQSFVIRINLAAVTSSPGGAVPRIRVEHVNNGAVWHFTNVNAAVSRLKESLDAIVSGSED
jgi:hypothetical protein